MKNMKAMTDEALELVTGGDYGDSNYEYENNIQLYNVGDSVQVYRTGFHITTVSATVIGVTKEEMSAHWYSTDTITAPQYEVQYADGTTEAVSADFIERK